MLVRKHPLGALCPAPSLETELESKWGVWSLLGGSSGEGRGQGLALLAPCLCHLQALKERKSVSGPGLWHAADWCLTLALGWWFEGLLKSVEVSETSAVSTWCPLLTFLFYVFLGLWALPSCLPHLPALRSRVGTTESSSYPWYLAWCLAHRGCWLTGWDEQNSRSLFPDSKTLEFRSLEEK